MTGGARLKVTEGSQLSRALTAVAFAAVLVTVADWGYAALLRSLAHAETVTSTVAVADNMARSVASSEAPDVVIKEVAALPSVIAAFVAQEGGVDDFGIARGAVLLGDSGPIKGARAARLLDHARSVSSAATEAAQRNASLAVERLQQELPGGQLAVAVPYRKRQSDTTPAGTALVVVAAHSPPPPSAPWRWLALILAPLLMIGLARTGSPRWLAGIVSMMAVLGIVIMAAPAVPITVAPLEVVSASLVFPHGVSGTSAALQQAPTWLLVGLLSLAITLGALVEFTAWLTRSAKADPAPYLYVGPAALATAVLVFVPFAVGVGLAFADRDGSFVGINNYIEVIQSLAEDASVTHFWRTLGHTVLWTVSNVTLHVTIGLALAILLNQSDLRGRRLYRLLLIVPWAVPNYITALTWKWLFNTQYGPINAMLGALGLAPVDWLGQSAATNFLANLATNVWLGFPFMMVISLGALQSIPSDLYEAASIDGANGWQKFRHITLPLLKPALFPAIILGTIWTFNAFNIIYLVSGGGPDHQTEILITEAYYLFTVLRRIGLAAAYSVLIFLLLLGYTLITNRLTQATEAVDR